MSDTCLYLLRHAQSVANADVLNADWPLSQRGLKQARDLVAPLTQLNIDKVFSSPYRRAIDTVSPFCKSLNTEIVIENNLRERMYNNVYVPDGWDLLMETAWRDFNFAPPGYETGYACQERLINCLTYIASNNISSTLLISSHGNAIALLLNILDSSFGYVQWQQMKNPDLFKLTFTNHRLRWDKSFNSILT